MTYFVMEVEGEAPEDISRDTLRNAINDELPGWAEAHITRFDGDRE